MKPQPKLIKAIHPADLLEQVNEAIKCGEDIYTPTFVSLEGLLCQWVIPTMCCYEYKLIAAMELDDLERQAVNLIDLGYDFFMNVVLWSGMYLQWMSRINNDGLIMKGVVAKLADVLPSPEPIGEPFKMVVDAQRLNMVSVPSKVHVVGVPYPVRFS